MNFKFYFLSFLLVFSRGCDFYSTSLWYFDKPMDETNPLSSILGPGWSGLIMINLIIVGLVLYTFYYYTFEYSVRSWSVIPEKLHHFLSEYYFQERGKFYQIFYKAPKDKNILIGHLGYILIRVVIFASFLATIHNLCQFYQVTAYNHLRILVRRPLFLIYLLILLSLVYFTYKLWTKEYEVARYNYRLNKSTDNRVHD